jgi:hypothetical protein
MLICGDPLVFSAPAGQCLNAVMVFVFIPVRINTFISLRALPSVLAFVLWKIGEEMTVSFCRGEKIQKCLRSFECLSELSYEGALLRHLAIDMIMITQN